MDNSREDFSEFTKRFLDLELLPFQRKFITTSAMDTTLESNITKISDQLINFSSAAKYAQETFTHCAEALAQKPPHPHPSSKSADGLTQTIAKFANGQFIEMTENASELQSAPPPIDYDTLMSIFV